MQAIELTAKVATEIVASHLSRDESEDGTARFLIDRLTGSQVAEICRMILADPRLGNICEIKIPRTLVAREELPADIVTDEKTTHFRHAKCAKPILILANTNDDQAESLSNIVRIGAGELKTQSELWIKIASENLNLTDENLNHWSKAMTACQKALDPSLETFAEYTAAARLRMLEQGDTLAVALGWALPVLKLPRDSGYFDSLSDKMRGQTLKWQKYFEQAVTKRKCLLCKETPTRKVIETSELQSYYISVKEQISAEVQSLIESFLQCGPGWTEESERLSEAEWEADNISLIFSGLKSRKSPIAEATIQLFEDEFPDTLSENDKLYLDGLRKRKSKEATDEDTEFYEKYRNELESDKVLKAKWDRLVYGQPLECTDFISGLVQSVERLRDQLDHGSEKLELHIRTSKGRQKSKWTELNSDVGCYFATRYRGLKTLLGEDHIKWDTHVLFDYPEFLKTNQAKSKGKKKSNKKDKNTSMAKAATELKFFLELKSGNEVAAQTQLIWKCNPLAVGMELRKDLLRLISAGPLRTLDVYREVASKKGRLQGLDLSDVSTFSAAFGQDKGSLVGKAERSKDLAKIIPARIKEGTSENRILSESASVILESWKIFVASYLAALSEFYTGPGLASAAILHQADDYTKLLEELLIHAPGDTNKATLIDPILSIGCAHVAGGNSAAIVTPWHPLRITAMAVKARQASGLIRHLLTAKEVDFGDSRIFFADIRAELSHPYYPEVCLGHKNEMPELLSVSSTVNDYSLMERPIRDESNTVVNDDPSHSAELIGNLVQRYLELMPHEKTNLSVTLYNCDSIRLPQAVVSHLSVMLDAEDEARCQIILRHSDSNELSNLYTQLLEASDANPDALVQSEISKDYIARLRLGLRADPIPEAEPGGSKSSDIVFLQEAISRRAQQSWERCSSSISQPSVLDHVPARFSYKKPSIKDDLKSTVYLTCPEQPHMGRAYLEALYAVLDGGEIKENETFLPARHISFKDDRTQKIIKDVHELGEWVANVDDILERRQLSNQNIRVIKYQQDRAKHSNLIVSSTSSLALLKVLVKRRLGALNLQLEDSDLDSLADKFIHEATQLSGDIVLRAAKNGRYASELIGVCLSKFLLKTELKSTNPSGWFFLDDYANWLGQKEGRIADLMVLSPNFDCDKHILTIAISESKYVDEQSVAEARRSSQKQLRETVERIYSAIFLTPGRLDRDLWLSRIGDLLLTGLEIAPTQTIDIEKFRNDVRAGVIPIELKGYSHVFVSGPNESALRSERVEIVPAHGCLQEVYSRADVRRLVLAYHAGNDLLDIRKDLGDDKPWLATSNQLPAAAVNWTYTADMDAQANTEGVAELDLEELDEEIEEDDETHETEVVTQRGVEPVTVESTSQISLESGEIQASQEKPVQEQAEFSLNGSGLHLPNQRVTNWICNGAGQGAFSNSDDSWLESVVTRLITALRSYDLQSKVIGQRLTPNAALIRLKGSDKLTVEDLEKRSSRLLTTHGLEIISVVGQPGEILVSITRPHRETVSLKTLWAARKINRTTGVANLSFVIGVREVDGEILYLNLGSSFEGQQQHAPHTLIAGATGSGKSILLQNLLLDICITNTVEAAHIYLIDPKAGVDYSLLEELPHLVKGIIVEQQMAIGVLESLVVEMDRRYHLFRQTKVKDLASYNLKVSQSEQLPALFLVHDEFAKWMLIEEYKAAVSTAVQRLGVKARAAGIYLIFAAQRPDANVLPIQLRDNLGNRLILRVESVGTSEITLGMKGAERLLGKGHLAARLMGESDVIFAQVPFLQESEIEELVSSFASRE